MTPALTQLQASDHQRELLRVARHRAGRTSLDRASTATGASLRQRLWRRSRALRWMPAASLPR